MSYLIDLTGQRFGRLVVLQRAEKPKGSKRKEAYWLCQCDCGNQKVVVSYSLKSHNTQSCGCYHTEIKTIHGNHNHHLYHVWSAIIQRCYNIKDKNYFLYGGRGIIMCKEWRHNFQSFYDWSYKNGYSEEKTQNGRNKLTIDRIDNDGNYCPDNCRWVTQKEQSNNTRRNHFIKINGQTKTMQQWADEYNMSKHTLYARYAKGLRGEDLIAPPKTRRKKES